MTHLTLKFKFLHL